MFETPNLDCLSIDPKDLRDAGDVLALLSCYAKTKASAMELRLAGDINRALVKEQDLERLYARLPQWARW